MRISWQCLAADETDHELLWLSVSLTSLTAAGIWLALGLRWPSCAFYSLTGLPCITCGATRSAIEFFRGHFLAAWNWNPLAFVIWCSVVIFDLYALVVLVARAPRLRLSSFSSRQKRSARVLMVALLIANWVWVLSRWQTI